MKFSVPIFYKQTNIITRSEILHIKQDKQKRKLFCNYFCFTVACGSSMVDILNRPIAITPSAIDVCVMNCDHLLQIPDDYVL